MTSEHRLKSVPLLAKEWRELFASRAFWFFLLMIGPLVGHAFITAIQLYAEASGTGGPAALPQGLTPLDGILAPTLGVYDLAATLLLPFVAIRLIAAEKESGALKLLLQLPGSLGAKVSIKGFVLLGGWLIAALPGLIAITLWKSYGGHLYAPETLCLAIGHLLRMMVSAAIAFAAAAVTESAASAAIITLGITVGTWALDFIAAGRGGWLQQLANYTPSAALRFFEQGLLRVSTLIVMLAVIIAGFALSIIWLHTGRTLRLKLISTMILTIVLAGVAFAAARVRSSWDVSENRRNSFSSVDETLLRQIREPLKITVFLSAEDPRLTDFEQNILKKLRRNLPRLEVVYAASSRTGLFENADEHYGEIWYEMGGRKVMERSTIDEVVLEQIYSLAGVSKPERTNEVEFPGYPLAVQPRHASLIFFLLWPLATILAWWLIRK